MCSKDVDFIINCECVFSVKVWIFFPLKCIIHIKTVMIRSRENLVSNYLPFFHYISLEKEALIKQSLLLCSCSYTASMDAPKVLNLAFCQLPRGTEGTRTEHHPFFLGRSWQPIPPQLLSLDDRRGKPKHNNQHHIWFKNAENIPS